MAESGDAMKEQQPPEAVSSPSRREVLQKGWDALKKVVVKPVQDFSGTPYPSEELNQPKFTRRTLLKLMAVMVISAMIPETKSKSEHTAAILSKPDSLPKDTLTDEELLQAHIKIYQTSETQLYLRKEVFNMPLFKDAKEGRLNQVVIVLVDHPTVSWNASKKLSEDARLVLQAHLTHPEEQLQANIKETEEALAVAISLKNRDQTDRYEKDPEKGKRLLQDREQRIEEVKQGLSKAQDQWNNRHEIIVQQADNNGWAGVIAPLWRKYLSEDLLQYYPERASRYEKLWQDHPELHNTAFIFIAAGKEYIPKPKDSYPSPNSFKDEGYDPDNPMTKFFHRFEKEPKTAGVTLRHEVFHYESPESEPNYEFIADTKMFESIRAAWERYKQKGDIGGYPFVFVTKEGMTITKNIKQQQPIKAT